MTSRRYWLNLCVTAAAIVAMSRTSPRNAKTTKSGQRTYDWRGESFHSVTTILNALSKPALVPWGMKSVATFAVDNYDKLSVLMDDREGAIDWLKGAPYRERDRAADLGTSVHAATEAYVLGRPQPKWPLPVAERMRAFGEFLDAYQPVYEEGMAEASVYNRTERYAGTLDAIVAIDGKRLLMDIKTGGRDIYPETAMQLAAYRYAEFVGAPDGSEVAMLPCDGAVALHLPGEGSWRLVDVQADEEVFKAFLYVRECFRWQQVTSRSVLRGDYKRGTEIAQLALREEF